MAAFFGRIGDWLYQRPYLLVCFTYLVWALNIVLGRYAADHIPPVAMGFLRWAVACAILVPVAWPHLKRDWPAIRASAPVMLLLGLTGTTGYAVMSYWGLQYTQAINGLVIQCTMPLVIGIMSFFIIGERPTSGQIAGIAVSMLGVLAILLRGDIGALRTISFNIGDIWFVGAVLLFGMYAPLTRKSPPMHPLSLLAASAVGGTLLMLPVWLWEIAARGAPPPDAKTIAIILYFAIFPSVLAYFCYNRSVQLLGPNRVAVLYPLVAVFGTIVAVLFLREQPQWYHLAGTLLIVAGVWLGTRQNRAAKA